MYYLKIKNLTCTLDKGVHVMFLIWRIDGRRFIDSMGVVASFPPVLYTGG